MQTAGVRGREGPSMKSPISAKEKGESGWTTSPVMETRQIWVSVCTMGGVTTTAPTGKMLE